MSLNKEALETAANGGLMEFEKWADMVEPLLERLDYIVHNVFPMPKVTEPPFISQPPTLPTQLPEPNAVPSSSNKENTSPADFQTPPRPAAPATTASPSSERVPDSQGQSFAGSNEILPAPLLLLLNSVKTTIRTFFTSKPPHTIQRLAELILRPNSQYRTLPAYLRALDRVVSVTSSADVFPLQVQASTNQTNGILNGGAGSFMLQDHAPGSDESLGGALLTPIPWLNASSLEMDSAPLDEGESLTVVTQEQHLQPDQPQPTEQPQEPDSTTVTQETTVSIQTTNAENETQDATTTSPPPETDEVPHARGPPVVGVEDMGLQDGKGVEMPLSNEEIAASNDQPTVHEGQQSTSTQDDKQVSKNDGDADGDGDIKLSDLKDGEKDDPAATDTP